MEPLRSTDIRRAAWGPLLGLSRALAALQALCCTLAAGVVISLAIPDQVTDDTTALLLDLFGISNAAAGMALFVWLRRAARDEDSVGAIEGRAGWIYRALLELAGPAGRRLVLAWWLTLGAGWLLAWAVPQWVTRTAEQDATTAAIGSSHPTAAALAAVGTILLVVAAALGTSFVRRITAAHDDLPPAPTPTA